MSGEATFIEKFGKLIKIEGFASITEFVNDWIYNGGTFKTMHDWILIKNIKIDRYTVWLNLRKYLTIPYSQENAFWYKWNSIAKTKGNKSIADLVNKYKKNLTTLEMSIELGTSVRTMEKLLFKINKLENKKTKKYSKIKNRDGFTKTNVKRKWEKILGEKGYKTLRNAIKDMQNKGMTTSEMAKELGVAYSTLKRRAIRGNIKIINKTISD